MPPTGRSSWRRMPTGRRGKYAANRQAGDAANRQEQLETAANRQAGVDAANREAGVDAANRQEELETAANRQAGVDVANREAGTKEEQSVKQADQAGVQNSPFLVRLVRLGLVSFTSGTGATSRRKDKHKSCFG